MRIQGVGGDALSWVEAIRGKKASQTMSEQIQAADEGDPAKALEMTSSILFGTPIKQESSAEAVRRESKEIQKKEAAQVQADITNDIKLKLSDAGVDPVALGVVKADEWSTISDPQKATDIAKIAALAQEKNLSDR